MPNPKVYLYAEFQVSIPFEQIDWKPVDVEMKKFVGLISKTWLSGINTHTVGGFYAFDSAENAQIYRRSSPALRNEGGRQSICKVI